MKWVNLILRIGLGLMLLMFGLNKFFWFMPDFDFTGYPEADHLFKAFRYAGEQATGKGYLMHLVGLSEVVIGVMLVTKKWVPLALAMLVPISINIVLFHTFLNIPNIGPAIIVAIVNAYLMYKHRDAYKSILT